MLKHLTFKNLFKLLFVAAFLGGLAYGGWELYMYFNVESLAYDLRHRDAAISQKAYDELVVTPPRRVIPSLIESLPQGDETPGGLGSNFEKVYELLAEITGEPYHEDPAEWRRWAEGPDGRRFLGKAQ